MQCDVRVHVELSDTVNGIRFDGETGSRFVNRKRITGTPYDELSAKPLPPDAVRLQNRVRPWGTANYVHMVEFLHCIRTGEPPISDVASQYRAASACHAANIAMRLGRTLTWNAQFERFENDAEADQLLSRPQRAGYAIKA